MTRTEKILCLYLLSKSKDVESAPYWNTPQGDDYPGVIALAKQWAQEAETAGPRQRFAQLWVRDCESSITVRTFA